jgi:hypothetical protein
MTPRSEARDVPSLLTVSAPYIGDEQYEEGVWEDGAYTAAPNKTPEKPMREPSAAQEKYYKSLLAQFRLLQTTLRCTPPLIAVERMSKSKPISFPADSSKAQAAWKKVIEEEDPTTVQMACMEMDSVWELISLLKQNMEDLLPKSGRTGAWIWAALGRCPDLGMMVSEEVGELRELAQQVISVGKQVHRGGASARADVPGAINNIVDAGEDDANAEQRLDLKTGMIVDAIATVVGELFGQRDLLEARAVWRQSET